MQDFSRYPRKRPRIDPLAAEKVLDLSNLVIAGLVLGIVLGESTANPFVAVLFLVFAILIYAVILSNKD